MPLELDDDDTTQERPEDELGARAREILEEPGVDPKLADKRRRNLEAQHRVRARKRAGKKGPRARASDTEKASAEEPPIPEVTEAEAKVFGQMGAVLWRIIAHRTGRFRELEEGERMDLGNAMAAVANKYAPKLTAWWPEINLTMTILALAEATKLEAPAPSAPPATGG